MPEARLDDGSVIDVEVHDAESADDARVQLDAQYATWRDHAAAPRARSLRGQWRPSSFTSAAKCCTTAPRSCYCATFTRTPARRMVLVCPVPAALQAFSARDYPVKNA